MNGNSRTAKSIKNSSVALIIYFINLVLQFFSRKIFLDHLGAEVLGLNTTATNLLQFLNLAELGIGVKEARHAAQPPAEGGAELQTLGGLLVVGHAMPGRDEVTSAG